MTAFADTNLTNNDFLGGRLRLWQPRDGYRAGIDPVLLAACVPAFSGQSVLELGCGAGAAILCLATRVSGLALSGVEVQPEYANLANRNAVENNIALDVVTADLTDLPLKLRQISFDHIIANPPYFRNGAHTRARDAGRAKALGEETPLKVWVETAARRLAPKGHLHLIQRIERLPELLAACTGRLGSLEVLPFAARPGRASGLFILRARKGGRAGFRMHAATILHAGATHGDEPNGYTADINKILRNGSGLIWPVPR
ncbi:MAG: methyltransferase [Rhodobacteraceae bacterium]|nr:methyltransferase [Paracoccaceae bacterium]